MKKLSELQVQIDTASTQQEISRLRAELEEAKREKRAAFMAGYQHALDTFLRSDTPNIYATLSALTERVEILERRLDNV